MCFKDSTQAKGKIVAYGFFFFFSESIKIKIYSKYLNVLMAMAKMLKLIRRMNLESAFGDR